MVFHIRNGTPYSDTNLLHKHLKPAGRKLGMPWLNWHTLRRTHATLLQHAGGTLKETQAQLGHTKMSTRTLVSPRLNCERRPDPSSGRAGLRDYF